MGKKRAPLWNGPKETSFGYSLLLFLTWVLVLFSSVIALPKSGDDERSPEFQILYNAGSERERERISSSCSASEGANRETEIRFWVSEWMRGERERMGLRLKEPSIRPFGEGLYTTLSFSLSFSLYLYDRIKERQEEKATIPPDWLAIETERGRERERMRKPDSRIDRQHDAHSVCEMEGNSDRAIRR